MTKPIEATFVTIDNQRTRDMDDAIFVHESAEGWTVRVAISDVSQVVTPGSVLDFQARNLGATQYFATGNSPMLPHRLSEDELSLRPFKNRKALVVEILLSPELEILSTRITLEKVMSLAKLNYSEIHEIVDNSEHPHSQLIQVALKLSKGLLTKRRAQGALVFYDLNTGWVTTEDGSLKQLKNRLDTVGYILIQELMILTNVAVALYAVEKDIPMLFRNHEAKIAAPSHEVLLQQISDAVRTPVEVGNPLLRPCKRLGPKGFKKEGCRFFA